VVPPPIGRPVVVPETLEDDEDEEPGLEVGAEEEEDELLEDGGAEELLDEELEDAGAEVVVDEAAAEDEEEDEEEAGGSIRALPTTPCPGGGGRMAAHWGMTAKASRHETRTKPQPRLTERILIPPG